MWEVRFPHGCVESVLDSLARQHAWPGRGTARSVSQLTRATHPARILDHARPRSADGNHSALETPHGDRTAVAA
eukprot:353105-Chlamydomonas_euryale.AAC.2